MADDYGPMVKALLGPQSRAALDRFRGVDPATGETDYWGRGGLAGMLGMEPWYNAPPEQIAEGFAGSITPKVPKVLDWSDVPLGRVSTSIAKRLGATKHGEGKPYDESGRRVYGSGGDRSRYYRLPNGQELRVSSHSDVNAGNSHFDLVIDPAAGDATLRVNPLRGMDPRQKPHTYEFSRDNPAGVSEPLDPSGASYGYTEHGHGGDGSAWTSALIEKLMELSRGAKAGALGDAAAQSPMMQALTGGVP